jgi:hypothetical protein
VFLGLCDFGRAFRCSLTAMMQRDDLLNKKRASPLIAIYLITPTDRHFSYYTHRMHTTWIVFCLSLFPPTFDFLAAFVATTSRLTLHIHSLRFYQLANCSYVSRRTLNCWFHSCTALASRLDFYSLTLISIWPTQNQLKPSKYSNCSADVKIWNYLLALCYGLKRECLFFTHDFCQKPAVFACCYAK